MTSSKTGQRWRRSSSSTYRRTSRLRIPRCLPWLRWVTLWKENFFCFVLSLHVVLKRGLYQNWFPPQDRSKGYQLPTRPPNGKYTGKKTCASGANVIWNWITIFVAMIINIYWPIWKCIKASYDWIVEVYTFNAPQQYLRFGPWLPNNKGDILKKPLREILFHRRAEMASALWKSTSWI